MSKRKTPGARIGTPRSVSQTPLATWLFGKHAVLAALGNPARRCRRLCLTREANTAFGAELTALGRRHPLPSPQTIDRAELSRLLPPGAVHQGIALLADPLPDYDLAQFIDEITGVGVDRRDGRLLVALLDQVTDPQNVGAIMRSAAAFGVAAVIAPRQNAAPPTGVLAKAASGALEHLPYIQTANLSRALEQLKAAGLWSVGLDSSADRDLADGDPGGPLAVVLGAEGRGLRRLTRDTCDLLLKLPTRAPIASLNVSNAAAVAFYQLAGRQSDRQR